jgi:hypothetical protein
MEDAPSVDALNRDDVESVQTFLHFWDQHVSMWHPDKNCPPAGIHPSAQLFNTLQDTKKELAEMLNHLQHHTKCAPGYCERKKKGSGKIFCCFGYPKTCRDHSELSKDPGRDFVELNTWRNDEILNSYNATFILGWRANYFLLLSRHSSESNKLTSRLRCSRSGISKNAFIICS